MHGSLLILFPSFPISPISSNPPDPASEPDNVKKYYKNAVMLAYCIDSQGEYR
ncbi:MAG: hypothetical protein RID53_03210 [Coleofasciculus sp. B1-GNL1-01]|uniref:hypothetical protein n=1 Tax=Coleofasciculus sp. B1-GNL1-01 TaxID=3068484 RepID=UPI0033008F08